MSQQFFDDFLPIGASCNTNQHTDTFDQYYTNANTNADEDADADNTGVLQNLVSSQVPWSTAPTNTATTSTTITTTTTPTATATTTMPRNSNGAIEVPAQDDPSSWNEKSLSPTRRSSTRTPSISSSHKSSISRASVSSKSSAPSADDSTSKRRTRSTGSGSGSGNNYSNHNKRDKFLERNRVAASKCRQRKKEWVSGLEEAKNGLEAQNSHLQMELNGLLGEVSRMKNQIMAHASCHDPNIDKWIDNEARRFVQGPEVAEYAGAAAVGYDSFAGPGAAPPFPPMGYQGFDEGTTRLSPAETIMSEMPGHLDDAERTRMCMRHPEAVSG
ncbi:uncharacterized protein DNG_09580 [Cephalotrichum gorgonifer]|uniref:BZIP domain-containing protein n=1 Tax=Cephalotrichum gorgonifer TaxID=2041049 RepID=A0AAE8SZF2_9PEZI|nr:uncharacterized protein DNG_09580 [Cephalotrichum gorgonifer]